jgi:hypothetical protein
VLGKKRPHAVIEEVRRRDRRLVDVQRGDTHPGVRV